MAVFLPRSIFFHIPKAGGTFVREVLPKAGVSFMCRSEGWNKHAYPCHVEIRDRFTFTFVRNPLTWYESYYFYHAFVSANGWEQQYEMHRLCGFGSFDHMIEKVIEYFPGYVSMMYKLFTQVDTAREVDFIGKQEHLREDLVQALKLAGEEFDEQIIHSFGRANVRPSRSLVWKGPLREKIVQLERFAIDRFGYRDQV